MLDAVYDYDVPLADAIALVSAAWADAWRIPARITVSQWADAHRQIAKGAGAEPGPWRTSRTPFLREIMDCLSEHSPVREVSFKKSAQIGATEVMINWVSYVIDHAPDAMIVAQPVKELARSWSLSKFEPSISLMPAIEAKIESNNTHEKQFPGGILWVIWANSSNQLRQRSARYVAEDELDEYPDDIGGQGSADEQLEARPLSFGDRGKIYRACTPTVAGSSKIARRYEEGDQRVYKLPCPHCGQHFALVEELLQDNGTFICPGCGAEIEEHHKNDMIRERSACATCGEVPMRNIIGTVKDGAEVRLRYADDCACGRTEDPPPPDGAYHEPTNPDADPLHKSYFIWAAYMAQGLGLSWREIADRRKEAAADHTKQAGFNNLILGLEFAGERQEQDSDEIAALAEPGMYLGTVPLGGLILTAGVDLQHDRAEVQVIAHGRGQRAWVVDYQVIDIDPTRLDTYAALDAYLCGTWRNAHGIDMTITAVAIDGGNWTETVAQYVKRIVAQSGSARNIQTGRGVQRQHLYLVRGRSENQSQRAVYRPSRTEVNAREKTVARSVGVWGVGTSVLKHLIYGWLSAAVVAKQEAEKTGDADPVEARMLRFPGGRGEPFDPLKPDPGALPPKYFKGLVAEYYDLDAKKWVNPKGGRNEPLDTAVYAFWAALSPAIKIDAMRVSQWEALENTLQPAQDLFSAPQNAPAPAQDPPAHQAPQRQHPPRRAPRGGFGGDSWSIT
ncbi:terminase [Lysobacteraceae bacterium NML75-0749]|nr:terminase [Xanthomonadaceae bacterium NML75-0749]